MSDWRQKAPALLDQRRESGAALRVVDACVLRRCKRQFSRSVGSAGPCPITAPAFVEMLFLCGGTDPSRCFILPFVLASRVDGDCSDRPLNKSC
jgi:hypothetical protein